MEFYSDTIRIVEVLCQQENFVHAGILLRAAFELSTRVLWASRTENGFDRIDKAIANNRLKLLENVKSIASFSNLVGDIDTTIKTQGLRKSDTQLPNMLQMLKEIYEHDQMMGLNLSEEQLGESFYCTVYRSLCGYAHGEMILEENHLSIKENSQAILVQSVYYFLKALHFTREYDKSQLPVLEKKLISLIKADSC